jgi:hypothetical protein
VCANDKQNKQRTLAFICCTQSTIQPSYDADLEEHSHHKALNLERGWPAQGRSQAGVRVCACRLGDQRWRKAPSVCITVLSAVFTGMSLFDLPVPDDAAPGSRNASVGRR